MSTEPKRDNVLISEGSPVSDDLVYDSIREQLDDLADEENATFIAPVGATLEQVQAALTLCQQEMQAELGDGESVKEPKYTVTIRIEVPNDPECHMESVFSECPREALVDKPLIGTLLGLFEKSIGQSAGIGTQETKNP